MSATPSSLVGTLVHFYESVKERVAKEATVVRDHGNGLVNVEWLEGKVRKTADSLCLVAHDAAYRFGGAFVRHKPPKGAPATPTPETNGSRPPPPAANAAPALGEGSSRPSPPEGGAI